MARPFADLVAIGRGGRTADALRTLVEAVGRRRGTPCDLEIVD